MKEQVEGKLTFNPHGERVTFTNAAQVAKSGFRVSSSAIENAFGKEAVSQYYATLEELLTRQKKP